MRTIDVPMYVASGFSQTVVTVSYDPRLAFGQFDRT